MTKKSCSQKLGRRSQRDRLPLANPSPRLRVARRRGQRPTREGHFLNGLLESGLGAGLSRSGLKLEDVLALRRHNHSFAASWAATDLARLEAIDTLLIDHLMDELGKSPTERKKAELDRNLITIWQRLKDEAATRATTPTTEPAATNSADDEAEMEQLIARVEAAIAEAERELNLPNG
ncbi:hypothetical protein FJQ54_07765 [Sandaracinobacter neustonicus]|uniref:Uncharacterized protein n=1 Tax=Sandaracinobacter neustonicus TaxID=1715348 RepID=A0A501XNQ7_9SPHN|nr:hypothetical protein [Sandaracinobacter neustonicus]TPE61787.1 hypothetical protein FJQ54_07765 [Sandaracinobacter neustonicus]